MDNGKLQIICGSGSGKSAMALGKGMFAVTQGRKVIMIQFLKGMLSAEMAECMKRFEPELKIFSFEKQHDHFESLSEDARLEEKLNIQNGINFARKVLSTGECDMLILDEFLGLLDMGMVEPEALEGLLSLQRMGGDLIFTGQKCPESLKERADLLTEVEDAAVDKAGK